MVLDQGLFAPSFLCVFVTAASTLQGLPFSVSIFLYLRKGELYRNYLIQTKNGDH